jgi:hypothetical protein
MASDRFADVLVVGEDVHAAAAGAVRRLGVGGGHVASDSSSKFVVKSAGGGGPHK